MLGNSSRSESPADCEFTNEKPEKFVRDGHQNIASRAMRSLRLLLGAYPLGMGGHDKATA